MTHTKLPQDGAGAEVGAEVDDGAPEPETGAGEAQTDDTRADWPTDGTCHQCGSVPRDPETGLCAICSEPDIDDEDPDAAIGAEADRQYDDRRDAAADGLFD